MSQGVRIAIAGFGLIGRRHAEIIQREPNTELVAILEPSSDAQAAAKRFGVPLYSDLETLLREQAPDGLVIATPTPLHFEQAMMCIQAGCPILIEKPITVNTQESTTLVEEAERLQVPILVGHHRRHNGMVQAAKAALQQGVIGEIRAVQALCWFYKPDTYFDAAPWRTQKGAGPLSVNIVHDVDLLRYFCGEVALVQAVAVPARRGFDNEDLASALLTFASGAVASISVSDSIVAPWSWELTARENPAYPATQESCYLVGGSQGSLSLPDLRLWSHDAAPDWWTPIAARHLIYQGNDPLVAQMQHFCRVVTGDETPLVSGREGLNSLAVVEAISQAAQTSQIISLGG